MTDLDKYLSDLGIDTDEIETVSAPPVTVPEPYPRPDADEGKPELAETQGSSTLYALPTPLVIGTDQAERCRSFLVTLLLTLDPTYKVELRPTEDGLQAGIYGGDSGRLIGRGGRTLAALEYLTNAVVNKDEGAPHVRVSVDIGGYKERRDERLRSLALKAAVRVRKTGFAVELEPMSAAERRVIHMALADEAAVESESSGEGKDRRVVVKPL